MNLTSLLDPVLDYTDHSGMPQNNGLGLSEYIPDDFASGKDDFDPFAVPTAQDSYQTQETGSAEGESESNSELLRTVK